MVDYNKRLVEVDEVLNHLSKENLDKIPEEIKNLIKENKDKDYVWHYDETKSLKDQNLNRDTIAFLSYLNMEYLLNDEQRRLMERIHEYNEQKSEQEKQRKYSNQELFKEKKIIENNESKTLTIFKETFIARIIKRIKCLFKKNKSES